MREIALRPRAYGDLESIWLYTNKRWGQGQANRYLRQLNERIRELAAAPQLGKSRQAIRPGYHSSHVGRHLIFYTFTDKLIGIERVLHQQMDVERHL